MDKHMGDKVDVAQTTGGALLLLISINMKRGRGSTNKMCWKVSNTCI